MFNFDLDYLVYFAVVVLLFFVGVALAAVKSKTAYDEEGEEKMFRHLYIYLVLFTTLLLTIGGSISVFMSVADIVSPNTYQASFAEYKLGLAETVFDENGNPVPSKKTDEEMRKDYEMMIENEKLQEKRNAMNKIVKSSGFILIPLPVFLYFKRQLRKKEA
ncbi:hypothetical protein [Fictibacillus nanhaiensis]|uniref:hypothetical protein n=1 Tax=Fictibacillus nanhaiensis TaxID=742169 RepID=UPI003C20586F